MDSIDHKIIRELQGNSQQTNNELAERVGLSPSPCLRRVRNLEKSGVITGYTALINQEKLGLPLNVFVTVQLERQTEETIEKFERHIKRIDEVLECYLMTGTSDYMLRVVSDSLNSYEGFIKEKLMRVPGVNAFESNFAIGVIKMKTIYPA